jgi:release factor glutamine methyltransferase
MFAKMTIKALFKQYIKDLEQIYSSGEAIAIAYIIFEYFISCSKTDIVSRENEMVSASNLDRLNNALQKLLNHEPVQYITGEAWFYNLKFKVNNAVLIPRPETEELVLEVINFLKNTADKKVLDIGTGSGCIPISIKKNVPNANIFALDISDDALEIAKANALANMVTIVFEKINILNEKVFTTLPSFDVIISNPPYIPENEKQLLAENVIKYEPHIALFVPQQDPLIFYKKIALFVETNLNVNGKIFLEVHEDLAHETATIFKAKNYEVTIKKDMQGKDRMLIIYRYQTR